jgi:ribonucleotide reductase alpha subunit
MKATGKSDVKESPYANCTANDIDWHRRVRLQAVVQKYTTHSISSTINLPADRHGGTGGQHLPGSLAQGFERHHGVP